MEITKLNVCILLSFLVRKTVLVKIHPVMIHLKQNSYLTTDITICCLTTVTVSGIRLFT